MSERRLQLKVRGTDRARFADDESLRGWAVDILERTLERSGGLPAGVIVVRERTVEVMDLAPLAQAGRPLSWMLAGLAGSTTQGGAAEAVGLVGRFQLRRRGTGPAVPVALAFLEWGDGHWWQWQALLAVDRPALVPDTATLRTAEAGDALPDGLGRWWTMQRRSGARLMLTPSEQPPVETSAIVH